MMLYPSINEDLRDKVDSRYTLVMLAARRARDIIAGKPVLTEVKAERPVSLATNEISEGLITYKRVSDEEMARDENVEVTQIASVVEDDDAPEDNAAENAGTDSSSEAEGEEKDA